jgi:uncharacterized protein
VQLRDRRLSFSPSDLTAFLACAHLTTLELAAARGEVARPAVDNAQAELIRRKGDEHERAYLAELYARGLSVYEVELGRSWRLAGSTRWRGNLRRARGR